MRFVFFVCLVTTLYLHLSWSAASAVQGVSVSELDGESVVVPFVQARHFLVIDVQVGPDDRPAAKFLFDTGMNLTMIDLSLARDLQLPLLQEVPATDSSGRAGKMGIHSLEKIRLGSITVTNVIAGAIDFGVLSQHAGVPISGIIGDNFLRQFCVQIDYRRQSLTFSRTGHTPQL